ncbi:hypothetical protein D3Z36_00685 [Lachnospiraceae bacterium]|nr:hypothetical protein [Lachnospiraceae bacterium]
MNQEQRITEFMRLMQEALKKTGITVAVESSRNLVVFDTTKNEPIELEITVGTEVVKEGGQTSVTVFDRSGD